MGNKLLARYPPHGAIMSRVAYIVSDYPIISRELCRSLAGAYSVVELTWSDSHRCSCGDALLVVLDVTRVLTHDVLPLLAGLSTPVRIAVASLERNEVDMYLLDGSGLSRAGALPSLLSLCA